MSERRSTLRALGRPQRSGRHYPKVFIDGCRSQAQVGKDLRPALEPAHEAALVALEVHILGNDGSHANASGPAAGGPNVINFQSLPSSNIISPRLIIKCGCFERAV